MSGKNYAEWTLDQLCIAYWQEIFEDNIDDTKRYELHEEISRAAGIDHNGAIMRAVAFEFDTENQKTYAYVSQNAAIVGKKFAQALLAAKAREEAESK
jgi:hypothetical protein